MPRQSGDHEVEPCRRAVSIRPPLPSRSTTGRGLPEDFSTHPSATSSAVPLHRRHWRAAAPWWLRPPSSALLSAQEWRCHSSCTRRPGALHLEGLLLSALPFPPEPVVDRDGEMIREVTGKCHMHPEPVLAGPLLLLFFFFLIGNQVVSPCHSSSFIPVHHRHPRRTRLLLRLLWP